MPGIVGLITRLPRAEAEAQLLRMVAALRHEPSYVTGTWIDESLGVYVGFVERRGPFANQMPLENEQRNLILTFSGEEFPDPEAVARLRQGGHALDAEGPSYLVHMAEEDAAFPRCLNGMFHGVLVDRAAGSVRLFNDRYGMHRLCYQESPEAFYFAAEAKGILAARPDLRQPSLQGLGEFLALSCVLENRTIFNNIFVLPAASSWSFRRGQIEKKETYFEPREWEQQTLLEPAAYLQSLEQVLTKNLPRYFAGPEQVGIALTGGMDTRVLLAQYKTAAGAVPCYTFGGPYRDCQDVRLARDVAKVCGQSHQVITVDGEYLKQFPQYAERAAYLSEGTVDVYRASDIYVSEKARMIAPVKVVGTYGSEIVRHAVMFKPMPPIDGLLTGEMAGPVRQAADTYGTVRRAHPVTFAAFRQSPWYHHGILALEQTQLTVRSPYLDNDFVQTVYRAPANAALSADVRLQLIRDGNRALAAIPSDRGVGGDRSALLGALSNAYLEFTFKSEYAYDYGMPQSVAKVDHWLAPLRLERLFLGRHKFLHYRVWYRDALSRYVREMLLDRRTLGRPYLNAKKLAAMVEGHLRGDRNFTTTIHKMLSLELLQRLYFDPQ
jgi:asparagine synthase (glutamine-hydrolysing)